MVKFVSFDEIVEYDTVEKLNVQRGLISLRNYPGGGWGVCLPISSSEYREKHPTLAAVSVFVGIDEITFSITDDHGIAYNLTITGEEMENPIVQREVRLVRTLKGNIGNEYN